MRTFVMELQHGRRVPREHDRRLRCQVRVITRQLAKGPNVDGAIIGAAREVPCAHAIFAARRVGRVHE